MDDAVVLACVLGSTTTGKSTNCAVVLDVSATQLVQVSVTKSAGSSKACDIAQKAAAIVAGRLPR